jgi:hypothetical protein
MSQTERKFFGFCSVSGPFVLAISERHRFDFILEFIYSVVITYRAINDDRIDIGQTWQTHDEGDVHTHVTPVYDTARARDARHTR